MPQYTTVATCALAQWALDYNGNAERIKESIRLAKGRKARYRLGPELEVCGYGCEDHFFESDTVLHSWEVLRELLRGDLTDNIVCDIGMPVIHENVRYNCRVICLNRRILMVRPKACLADDGNYRESRWFTAWTKGYTLVELTLPRMIREVTNQTKVPFGIGALRFNDTMLGGETCEELFTPDNPGIVLGLAGCEIIGNGSGSHHTMGKLSRRLELMQETTRKNGGLYLYANQQGCDGSRLYFDGAAIIVLNGVVVAQGTQFSMKDVEVVAADVDLADIGNYRTAIASRGVQAAQNITVPKVDVDFYLTDESDIVSAHSLTRQNCVIKILEPEEEIAYGPACWLWDYLRRSGQSGFFLPLSGGADSACSAAIVGVMCQMLFNTIQGRATYGVINTDVILSGQNTKPLTLSQLRRVTRDPKFTPSSPKEIAKRLFYTCYIAESAEDLVGEARKTAERLAVDIGCTFVALNLAPMVAGALQVVQAAGLPAADIQASASAMRALMGRTRMVLSFLSAELSSRLQPAAEGTGNANGTATAASETASVATTNATTMNTTGSTPGPAPLLVLGAATLDDGLIGSYVRNDCSAADINPIGALSKENVLNFLRWAGVRRDMPTLTAIAEGSASSLLQEPSPSKSPPTPQQAAGTTIASAFPASLCATNDTDALTAYGGLSIEELHTIAKMRIGDRCGPLSLFRKLLQQWEGRYTPAETADKVKGFFRRYALHRHKVTTLPPSYHLENASCDDNRFDMRQALYDPEWTWQFDQIDRQLHKERQQRKRTRDD